MGSFKEALQNLNSKVEDLTSLHVQTFTGKLNITINNTESFDSLRKTITTEANKKNGTIKLVAETLAQFDGDSYNFVNGEIEDFPRLALEVHKNAVASGIETRLGLLELFKDLLDK
ncbi:MAG: hypothetical protein AAF927_06260 [Bacteroidota bacterium]